MELRINVYVSDYETIRYTYENPILTAEEACLFIGYMQEKQLTNDSVTELFDYCLSTKMEPDTLGRVKETILQYYPHVVDEYFLYFTDEELFKLHYEKGLRSYLPTHTVFDYFNNEQFNIICGILFGDKDVI